MHAKIIALKHQKQLDDEIERIRQSLSYQFGHDDKKRLSDLFHSTLDDSVVNPNDKIKLIEFYKSITSKAELSTLSPMIELDSILDILKKVLTTRNTNETDKEYYFSVLDYLLLLTKAAIEKISNLKEVSSRSKWQTTYKDATSRHGWFLEVLTIQRKIADNLNALFSSEIDLKKIDIEVKEARERKYPLNLSNIKTEYQQKYKEQHGNGSMGFFKLAIKNFFQQNTRMKEIEFLETLEVMCDSTEKTNIDKDQLKLDALKLVSLKIASETYGNNSLLSPILKQRIKNAGFENDLTGISKDLMQNFEAIKITVPPHLKEFYKQLTETAPQETHLKNQP